MQRYFVPFLASNDVFDISGEDFRHIVKVMRMKVEDEIICVTENHKTALCKITDISTEQVTVQVVQWMEECVELPIGVTIVNGLPKGDKLDLIIQKGTELGASKFIPFIATRSIVKWDEKKADKKISRWQKIAKEAAEQSHRSLIPKVEKPVSIQSLIDISESYDVKLIAYEEESRLGETKNLVKSLQTLNKGGSLLVVFGPEGGLSIKKWKSS